MGKDWRTVDLWRNRSKLVKCQTLCTDKSCCYGTSKRVNRQLTVFSFNLPHRTQKHFHRQRRQILTKRSKDHRTAHFHVVEVKLHFARTKTAYTRRQSTLMVLLDRSLVFTSHRILFVNVTVDWRGFMMKLSYGGKFLHHNLINYDNGCCRDSESKNKLNLNEGRLIDEIFSFRRKSSRRFIVSRSIKCCRLLSPETQIKVFHDDRM